MLNDLYQSIPQNVRDVLVRHKRTCMVLPLAIMALGVAVIIFWPRSYRSEARVFLRVGRENIGLDPTVNTGATMSMAQTDRKDEVKSAIEVLRSPSVAGKVVDLLGEDVVLGRDGKSSGGVLHVVTAPFRAVANMVHSLDPISDRETALNAIERHLDATAERESTVIVVTYKAKTPQLAQKVCQAVIDVYREEHMRIHRNEESSSFFTEQKERLRKQLDEAAGAVRTAKNEAGFANIEQRQKTLEAQFDAVELDRLRTQQELVTSQARIADLEQQLAKVPERVIGSKKAIPNQGADLLHQKLYELELKAMDLKSRYKENHPLVEAVNAQVVDAKKVLEQEAAQRMETTDDLNPIHRQLQLDLQVAQSVVAGATARLAELTKQKESVLTDLRSLNDADFSLDQLDRQADLARDKYLQYARNLEESRIDRDLELGGISNLSVVQPAMLSEKPASPSTRTVAALSLVCAIAGTIGFVLLREKINPRPPQQAEAESMIRRRLPRRRVHRELVSKANGQT